MAAEWGLERLGFLTLTFRDHVTDIREAQRRFNSLRTGVLSTRYAASIAVVERMKSGRIHFHVLLVLAADIRTGFDFDQVGRRNYSSAGAALRSEWAFWNCKDGVQIGYGFGRTELLPVKSTAEGIGKYVGKYIAKHIESRVAGDKGARLVRYTRNARKCGTRFAWAGLRGWLWRAKLAKVAVALDCHSLEALRAKFGARWAFHLAGVVASEVLDTYPSMAHAIADGVDVPQGINSIGPVTVQRVGGDLVPHFRDWVRGSGAKGAPVRPDGVPPVVEIVRRWDCRAVPESRPARAVGPVPV